MFKLKLIEQRINSLENRVGYLNDNYSQANQRLSDLNENLNAAQQQVVDLKEQYGDTKQQENQIASREATNKLNIYALRDELEKATLEAQQAELQKNNKENQLELVKRQIADIKWSLSSVQQELQELYNIIQEPEPKSEYRLDGEYCINHIYHCKNHPPRQILVNEDEINEYREKIKNAQKKRAERLMVEEQLREKINSLQEQATNLSLALQAATYRCWSCQDRINFLNQQILENNELESDAENAYNGLTEAEDTLSIQLNNAESKASVLKQGVADAEREANDTNVAWQRALAELQRAKDEYDDLNAKINEEKALEELARSELRKESQQNSGPVYDTSGANDEQSLLKMLAQMELAQEAKQLANTVRNDIGEVKKFLKDVGTTAGDIWPGAHSLQVKAIFNQINQEFGTPEDHTGDLFIDYANRNNQRK